MAENVLDAKGYCTVGLLSTASKTFITGSVTTASVAPGAAGNVRSSTNGGHGRNTGATRSSKVTAAAAASSLTPSPANCTAYAYGDEGTNVSTAAGDAARLANRWWFCGVEGRK